ncbi:MAG: hypothetical protein QM783_07100 [Phycisphaerales bacterium]
MTKNVKPAPVKTTHRRAPTSRRTRGSASIPTSNTPILANWLNSKPGKRNEVAIVGTSTHQRCRTNA